MHTAVVIVAAGRGARMGGEAGGRDAPAKQYRALGGAPVLTRTLSAFVSHPAVDGVLTVIHPADRDRYAEASAAWSGELLEPALGGATRQESVRAGLEALERHKPRNVLIHDAARPFVPADLVGRVVEALAGSDGAVPGLPVPDTLKQEKDGRVARTLDRAGLYGAQTPQGFRFDAILAAHRAAVSAGETGFTDDSAVAEWRGLGVALVEGASANVKLTTREDFELAEARLIAAGELGAAEMRVGHGYDVHGFTEGDHVMLCGVRVPHDRALSGHSDADAGLHALTDALLGAIGDGDIGAHFPPSDPAWKDAASGAFLREAAARVEARGGRIVNVDVTLVCEAPKVGPHREAMRARIAEILGIGVARVSVKATTTEGLGFTGRGEGVAAQATAAVRLG